MADDAAGAVRGTPRPDKAVSAEPATTFELLDAAAERGHNSMFEGDLPADGIERALWHQVALAVLDDPRLLPTWAQAARGDADNWHRQCRNLDAELEDVRQHARNVAAQRDVEHRAHLAAAGQIAAALRWLDDPQDLTPVGQLHQIRAALQGDQPTEPVGAGLKPRLLALRQEILQDPVLTRHEVEDLKAAVLLLIMHLNHRAARSQPTREADRG